MTTTRKTIAHYPDVIVQRVTYGHAYETHYIVSRIAVDGTLSYGETFSRESDAMRRASERAA